MSVCIYSTSVPHQRDSSRKLARPEAGTSGQATTKSRANIHLVPSQRAANIWHTRSPTKTHAIQCVPSPCSQQWDKLLELIVVRSHDRFRQSLGGLEISWETIGQPRPLHRWERSWPSSTLRREGLERLEP
jgi:hypothetical protein